MIRSRAQAPLSLPIETPRLLLRDFRKSDVDAVHAYSALPEVARFMIWGPNSPAQSREAVEGFLEDQAARPRVFFDLAMTLKPRGQVIGGVGLHLHDRANRTGDLGYVLHPDCWGYGLAEEAARALMEAGFLELGLRRIVASCDQRNRASARVMEKLGMRREGAFRQSRLIQGEWRDEYLYAILAEEFLD